MSLCQGIDCCLECCVDAGDFYDIEVSFCQSGCRVDSGTYEISTGFLLGVQWQSGKSSEFNQSSLCCKTVGEVFDEDGCDINDTTDIDLVESISLFFSGVAFAALLILIVLAYRARKRKEPNIPDYLYSEASAKEESGDIYVTLDPRQFDLLVASQNEILGQPGTPPNAGVMRLGRSAGNNDIFSSLLNSLDQNVWDNTPASSDTRTKVAIRRRQ